MIDEEVKEDKLEKEMPGNLEESKDDANKDDADKTVEEEDNIEGKSDTEDVKSDGQEKKSEDFSIFITDSDTFDIDIQCYKDGNELKVKGIDGDYDDTRKSKKISIKFKRPSQGDLTLINTQAGKWSSSPIMESDDTYRNLMSLEFARMIVLIREWTLPDPLTVDVLVTLDPKIVKAIVYEVREKISMDGII